MVHVKCVQDMKVLVVGMMALVGMMANFEQLEARIAEAVDESELGAIHMFVVA